MSNINPEDEEEAVEELKIQEKESTNSQEQNPTVQTPKRIRIKKIQKKPKPQILNPDNIFPRSIIYEDPELTSSIEFTESNIGGIQKLTKKFSQGTIFNSIFKLFYSSPFITIIFYPYAFVQCGFVIGLIVFTLVALNSYFTSFLVLRLKQETNANSYRELLLNHIGKWGDILYNVVYFAFCFGISLIYLYVYLELSNEIINTFGGKVTMLYQILVLLGGFLIIGLPTVFIKSNKIMRKLKIATLALLTISIIFLLFYKLTIKPCGSDEYKVNHLIFKSIGFNYSKMIAILFLSLANHPFLFRQMKNLNMFTMKRGKKLFLYTTIVQFFYYVVFGIVGLLANIFCKPLNFYPIAIIAYQCKQFTISYYINLFFKGLIAILCEFNVSHSIIQFFDSTKSKQVNDIPQVDGTDIKKEGKNIDENEEKDNNNPLIAIEDKNEDDSSDIIEKRNKLVQKIIIIGVGFCANLIFYFLRNQIDVIFGVVGGICTTFLCYIIPVYCFMRIDKNIKIILKAFIVFAVTAMSIIGMFATVVSIVYAFKN